MSAFLQYLLGTPDYCRQRPWTYSYLRSAGWRQVINGRIEPQQLHLVTGKVVELTFDPHSLERGQTLEAHDKESSEEI
jgi:hypothetical protein